MKKVSIEFNKEELEFLRDLFFKAEIKQDDNATMMCVNISNIICDEIRKIEKSK